MGLAGAAAWGIVGFVCLAAAGYSLAHGQGGCVDANVFIWVGFAALTFGFALLSLSVLALPVTGLALVVALILLLIGGAALVGSNGGCELQFFSYLFHVT